MNCKRPRRVLTSDAAFAVVVMLEVPDVLGVGVPAMSERDMMKKRVGTYLDENY